MFEQVTRRHPLGRLVVVRGAWAGLLGGAAFLLMMLSLHGVTERWVVLKLAAYPFLGNRVFHPELDPGAVLLGLAVHLVVSMTWGILFAWLAHGLSRPATVLLGAVWGVVVWMAMFLLVLPVVTPALAEGGASSGVILSELVFGLTVGIALAHPRSRVTPARRPWILRRPTLGRPHIEQGSMFTVFCRTGVVAALALLSSHIALAGGGQCTVATKGDSPVAEACRRGGRAEAKKVMKAAVDAAKKKGGKLTCDDCHKGVDNDDFTLKPNAREDFKKLLQLAGLGGK